MSPLIYTLRKLGPFDLGVLLGSNRDDLRDSISELMFRNHWIEAENKWVPLEPR